MTKRWGESGNVFFTLFGAVALVGVVGAATSTLMRGPVGTVVSLNQRAKADSQMQIAMKLAMLEAQQRISPTAPDCDADTLIEPLAPGAALPGLTGGGQLPSVGSTTNDPWGVPYGYCAWDHAMVGGATIGSGCAGAGLLDGEEGASGLVLAIISAGPDRTFGITCNAQPAADYLTRGVNGADDIVVDMTYAEANEASGGLWHIKSGNPDQITTGKELDVQQGAQFSSGNVDFSGATITGTSAYDLGAALDLSAGGFFMLPDQSVLANSECDDPGDIPANSGLLRRYTGGGGEVLQICDGITDPMNPAWTDIGGSGGAVAAAGNNTEVQFNAGGVMSASPNFVWTGTTLDVTGAGDFSTDMNVGDELTVGGAADLNGALDVAGITNLQGALDVGGVTDLNNALNVTGAADFGGTLNADGAATFGNTLAVTSDATFGLQIFAADGLESRPAYSFTSSNSTGIYYASAGMGFSIGGTNEMTLSSSGLEVTDLTVQNTISADRFLSDMATTSAALPGFQTEPGTGMFSPSDNVLSLVTGGTSRFVIDGTGDVGIGVASPDAMLDVGGEVKIGTSAVPCALSLHGAIRYVSGDLLQVCSSMTNNWEDIGTSGGGGGGAASYWTRISIPDPRLYYTDDFVGVGTNDPLATFHVNGDFLNTGNYTGAASIPVAGAGTRMFFDAESAAFRMGLVSGNRWDNASLGDYSVAMGYDTQASGDGSVALGIYTQASALGAIALGTNADATGLNTMALGLGSPSITNPIVSGQRSFGIYMGDQSGVDLQATNTMALLGGRMLIDQTPAVNPAVSGTLSLDVEGGVGAVQYCDEDGTNCFTAASVATGGVGAPGLNREVIFNSSGVLGTDTNFVFTSSGQMGIGTDTPLAALDVRGTGILTGNPSGASTISATGAGDGNAYSAMFITDLGTNRAWGMAHSQVLANAFVLGYANGLGGWLSAQTVMNDGRVLFSSSATIHGALHVDVDGPLGATEYCDNFGLNCFTADDITNAELAYGADGTIQFASGGALWSSPNYVWDNGTSTLNVTGNTTISGLLDLTTNGAMVMPRGTTATRPAGTDGMIRYNSETGKFEGHQGGNWYDIITSEVAGGAASPDRGIQFNSGGDFAASSDFVYTSQGDFMVFNALGGPPSVTMPVSGAGRRLVFDAQSGAFRAGGVTGTQWDTVNSGLYSAAFGINTVATGESSFVTGYDSQALGYGSFVAGNSSVASGWGNVAIGVNATTGGGDRSFALGSDVRTTGSNAFSFGLGNVVGGAAPITSGGNSYGIFMGNHPNINFAAASTMGLFGGNMVIDPRVPASQLAARSVLDLGAATDSIVMPSGTTAQRPGAPVEGMIRYNAERSRFEGYQAGQWQDILTGSALAAAPDRGIQFNSGGNFAADGNFVFSSTGDLLLSGTYTGAPSVPASGAGTRMFFDVQSGAIRAGSVTAGQWDDGSVGANSIALGQNVTASGFYSTAIGSNNSSSGTGSVALGIGSTASNAGAVALGQGAAASGLRSTAIGMGALASGDYSFAVQGGTSSSPYSIAMGYDVVAGGDYAMGIGLGVPSADSPTITGTHSLGVFMGNQTGRILSANNTMGLFGGRMVIDPRVPATNLSADTAFEVEGTIKMAYGGELCDAAREGAIHYDSSDNNFYVCKSAGAWDVLATGTPSAAAPDRGIQFNSGGNFTADSGFVYTSTGNVGIGTGSPIALLEANRDQDAYTVMGVTNNTDGAGAASVLGAISATAEVGLVAYPSNYWATHLADRASVFAPSASSLTGRVASGLDLIAEDAAADMRFYTGGFATTNERMRITATGHVGIGTGTVAPTSRLTVAGNNEDAHFYSNSNTNNFGFDVEMRRSRGTYGTPTAVQPGDKLGGLRFYGYDSTQYEIGSAIYSDVDPAAAIVGDENMPTYLGFHTRSATDAEPLERMRITPTGDITFSATGATKLHSGTTAQRPVTPVNGMIRYNSQSGKFEGYQAGAWQDILTSAVAGGAAAPDRGIQFNSGGNFAADSNFIYTSRGTLIVSGTNTGIVRSPSTLSGSHMFFDPSSGAFRAGGVFGGQWDSANVGGNSVAMGSSSLASAQGSVSIGVGTQATNSNAVSIGNGSIASGDTSVALGEATASGNRAFAVQGAAATSEYAIAMGYAVTASGDYAMGIGLGVPPVGNPIVSGTHSLGIFMGDQSTRTLSASNTMGLFGGRMVIDPRVPATNLSADTAFEVEGTIKMAYGGEVCDAAREGAIHYDSSDNNFYVCKSAGSWDVLATGTPSAAAPNRGVQFNSGGSFAATSNFEYTSQGGLKVGGGTNTGVETTTLGSSLTGSGSWSFVAGDASSATANWTAGIGFQANATAQHSRAIGSSVEASGFRSTALGVTTVASGINSMSLGLTDQGVVTRPDTSGTSSLGIFMGDQNAVDILASRTMVLAGGSMVIDPRQPATNLSADTAFEVEGTIKMAFGGEACDAAREGAIHYDSSDNNFYVCKSAGSWDVLATGTPSAAAPDRGIQFNSGGSFTADANFVYSSQGAFMVSGTFTGTSLPPVTGGGTRMFFDPNFGSFRAGTISADQWDTPNMGMYSFAFGDENIASGYASAVFGDYSEAAGNNSFAVGNHSHAIGNSAIAMGSDAYALGNNSAVLNGYVSTASGLFSTTLGSQVIAGDGVAGSGFGDGSMAIGLMSLPVAITTRPQVRGDQSLGIFMGDQDGGLILNDNNTMGLFGGSMVIDPRVPASNLSADTAFEVEGTIKMAYGGEVCDAAREGAIHYDSSDNNFYVCKSAGSWDVLATGTPNAAAPDRGIQFNSGGSFAADANFTYTSVGDFVVGSYQLGDTGTGSEDNRMFFDVSKGAFRAGIKDDEYWDDTHIGIGSVAFGGAGASAPYTFAVGENSGGTWASGYGAVAFGGWAEGSYSFTMGGRASGTSSKSFGSNDVSGDFSIAFALEDHWPPPEVTADNSMAIFMNNQSGVDFAATDTLGLFGGRMVIDPRVPASNLSADTAFEVEGTIKMAFGGETCDADREGAIHYNSSDNNFYVCKSAGSWDVLATGTPNAAAPDRGIQFNSGGSFAASANLTFTSVNELILGANKVVADYASDFGRLRLYNDTGTPAVSFDTWHNRGPFIDVNTGNNGSGSQFFGAGLSIRTNNVLGIEQGLYMGDGVVSNAPAVGVVFYDTDGGDYARGGLRFKTNSGSGLTTFMQIDPVGDVSMAGTGALTIHSGDTAQRPGAPVNGMLRYNSQTGRFEGYQAGSWQDIVTGAVGAAAPDRGIQFNSGGNFAADANFTYTSTGILGVGTSQPQGVVHAHSATNDGAVAISSSNLSTVSSVDLYTNRAVAGADFGNGSNKGWSMQAVGDSGFFGGYANYLFIKSQLHANPAARNVIAAFDGVNYRMALGSLGAGATPLATLHVFGTDSIILPSGTTAQRSVSPVNGMLRYNSQTGKFEGYQAGTWQDIVTGAATSSFVSLVDTPASYAGSTGYFVKVNPTDDGLIFSSSLVNVVGGIPAPTGLIIDDLDDVIVAAPTTGQTLTYNGTNWVNSSSGLASAGGTDTQIQFNSGGTLEGSANFTWDNTLGRLTIASTDSVALPSGSTAQRPVAPVNGMLRYNSQNGKFEGYQAGTWQDIVTGAATGTFAGLTDTPASYAAEAGKFVRVNSAEDGVEFTDQLIESVAGQPLPTAMILDDLGDVAIAAPTTGQTLSFNGSAWVNSSSGLASAGGADTQVQFNSGGALAGSAGFIWNNTLGRLTIASTDSVALPSGSTAQRPGTPVNGMLRYNSQNGKFEGYQAGTWQDIVTGAATGTFAGLTDTPASYAGSGNMYVRVNTAEDALEFTDTLVPTVTGQPAPVAFDLAELGDVGLSALTDGQILYYSNGAWVNGPVSSTGTIGGLDDLDDASVDYTSANMFIGQGSGANIADGDSNLGIGLNTLGNHTEGSWNTAVGMSALANIGGGLRYSNTALGAHAGEALTNASANVMIGAYAMGGWTSGSGNIAIGDVAMNAIGGTGDDNVAVGNRSLNANNGGSSNVAVGSRTLNSNAANSESTAIGYEAMRYANDTAVGIITYNTAVGAFALQGSATAADNTGTRNTAVGHSALSGITSGVRNTALGNNALVFNSQGNYNVGIGYRALEETGGENNIALGARAGYTITSGSDNIMIGYDVQPAAPTDSNRLNIGNAIYGDLSSDFIGIGNAAPNVALDVTGDMEYTGVLTDVSDRRLKDNIVPMTDRGSMLEKLGMIDTYSFTMKGDDKQQVEFGVMAQDMQKIFPELVRVDETSAEHYLSVNYIGMIAPIMEATKELKAENDALKAELASLKSDRAQMMAALDTLSRDVQGLKAHTGYGISKASLGLGMLVGLLVAAAGSGLIVITTGLARRRRPKTEA